MKPFNKEQEGKNWINTFRLTWTHHYNFPGIYKKQKKHANYNLYLCTLLLSKIFVQRTFYFLYIIDIKQNFLFALDCRFKTSFIRKNSHFKKWKLFGSVLSVYPNSCDKNHQKYCVSMKCIQIYCVEVLTFNRKLWRCNQQLIAV